jgi:hypothetical protein
MIDKFQFCDNQTFTDIDSTGEVSDNIWDIEEDASVDQQIHGWLNVHVISAVISGLTQGVEIQLRSSDAAAMATSQQYLGVIRLEPAEFITGARYCIGVNRAKLKKYVGVWAIAINTQNTGAVLLEVWFSEHPYTGPDISIQKKPS